MKNNTNQTNARDELTKLIAGHPDAVAQICVLEQPGQHSREAVESALFEILAALKSGGRELTPAFWDMPAGQLVARAQWELYGDDAVMPLEAARLLYAADLAAGRITENAAKLRVLRRIEARELPSYRRPDDDISHRAERTRSRNEWYLRRDEVKKSGKRR